MAAVDGVAPRGCCRPRPRDAVHGPRARQELHAHGVRVHHQHAPRERLAGVLQRAVEAVAHLEVLRADQPLREVAIEQTGALVGSSVPGSARQLFWAPAGPCSEESWVANHAQRRADCAQGVCWQ